MRRSSLFVVIVAIACAPALAHAQTGDVPSSAIMAAPQVQPEAIAALEKMSAYLRSLKQFGLHADTTIDLVMEDGQKLEFPGTLDYKVRSPNGLYIGMK